jgi:hypothetical protein
LISLEKCFVLTVACKRQFVIDDFPRSFLMWALAQAFFLSLLHKPVHVKFTLSKRVPWLNMLK